MLLMNVGQVVEVKLLDRPPSKGLGSALCAAVVVVAAAVEDVAEGPELESSLSEAVLAAVAVDIVIANVVVTVLWADALLQNPFSSPFSSSGSTIAHTPRSRTAGACVSSNSVSARSGAAVGSGSSSRRGDASVCEAKDTARHNRAAAHGIRGLWW